MAARGMGSGEVYWEGQALLLPPKIAHQISRRAAEIIKQNAPLGPKNSRRLVVPTNIPGQIGVMFPPSAMHLVYLDKGIRPFVMKSLEGKTIPIMTPGGLIFRKAKNVGKRKIIARDEKGRIVNTKISWRHPGIRAMDFIQPAIKQAIEEWVDSTNENDLVDIIESMGGQHADFIQRLRRGLNIKQEWWT